jgi:glycosyltransferase involved in cell wall biosynthesis
VPYPKKKFRKDPMNKNILIAPAFYEGTSFERIASNANQVIADNDLPIDVMVFGELDNNLTPEDLDDTSFFECQLEAISYATAHVTDYERMLFLDFFNPGVDLVRYAADRYNPSLKMASLLHGGSFIEGDLLTQGWLRNTELAWTTIYDRIFVPSRYAFESLPPAFLPKAMITPWGVDSLNVPNTKPREEREGVLFPHRLSSDKGLEDFLAIARALPDVKFSATTASTAPLREDVLVNLRRAKNIEIVRLEKTEELYRAIGSHSLVLSCAKQELFGFSVAEAVIGGCVPVLRNDQCYTEYYPEALFFNTVPEAIERIEQTTSQIGVYDGTDFGSTIRKTSVKPLLDQFISF